MPELPGRKSPAVLQAGGCLAPASLAAGQRKDGGLTPAQLAWVLSQTTIVDAALPVEVPPAELRAYVGGLIDRLVRLAYP